MSKKKHSIDIENDQHKQSSTHSSESDHESKSGNTMSDCE